MARRILLAEDSEQTRRQLKTLLEADGAYEVDTAADGKAALDAFEKHSYSCFVTDLRMPKLDGMRMIEEIRSRQWPVTVIVMSGFGGIAEAVRAVQLGAYDFLPKPIDIDHLRLVLERAARERGLQAEVAQLRQELRR